MSSSQGNTLVDKGLRQNLKKKKISVNDHLRPKELKSKYNSPQNHRLNQTPIHLGSWPHTDPDVLSLGAKFGSDHVKNVDNVP